MSELKLHTKNIYKNRSQLGSYLRIKNNNSSNLKSEKHSSYGIEQK